MDKYDEMTEVVYEHMLKILDAYKCTTEERIEFCEKYKKYLDFLIKIGDISSI